MRIRDFEEADAEALRAMHKAQGFDYTLPRLDDRLFIVRRVLEGQGRPQAAILGRLTSEAYYLDYPDTNPLTRARRFSMLAEDGSEMARMAGVDSVHVWIPPILYDSFGKQLSPSRGWQEYTWHSFARYL